MIRIFRRSFCTVVECDCGFRQTANTAAMADATVNQHTCKPVAPRRHRRGDTSNSR